MAQSLSYKEAVAKGLVYPGSEETALKLTGGGKGFASTESFKQAFDQSYQTKKSEVDALRQQSTEYAAINTQANQLWNQAMGASSKAYGGALNRYFDYVLQNVPGREEASRAFRGHVKQFQVQNMRDAFIKQINELNTRTKSLSGQMETAMGKYKTATEKSAEAQTRETGAAKAARKRLTRGTAGLLAKAGAGGMVGTGLPELGTGVSSGLGMESQLGRKITL